MKLTPQEAAQLLQVSERTILRWVRNLSMPHQETPEGNLFDRDELIAWADRHSFRIALEVPGEQATPLPELAHALERGGIHYEVPGRTVEDALGEVAFSLKLPELVDREFFHQVLLAREDLGSTGIGEGFAIPHVRSPLVLHVEEPIVGLFFLDSPLEWAAIDRSLVHTLFTVVSPGLRAHLHLLSRITFALKDPVLRKRIEDRSEPSSILEKVSELDKRMGSRP